MGKIQYFLLGILFFLVVIFIFFLTLDQQKISINKGFDQLNSWVLFESISGTYKLNEEELRMNQYELEVSEGIIKHLKFTLIEKTPDNYVFVYTDGLDSSDPSHTNIKTRKSEAKKWAQYEYSIDAGHFFNTMDAVKKLIADLEIREFSIVSSGMKEIQGQYANYYKWVGNEFISLDSALPEESYAIIIIPTKEEERMMIIYI